MDDHDDIRERLRALGAQPVDPGLQSAHLTAMAQAPSRRSLRPKLRTAAVFLAGLLVGGSGLAAAGALPDPAQHAAHRVLDSVGIDVPDPPRYHGPECGAEVKRNHGAYVRDDHSRARSECGKRTGAGKDGGKDDARSGKPEKGPCAGPPPWAGPGKRSMTSEEKAAAQAQRATECGEEPDEAEEADEPDEDRTTEPTTGQAEEPPTTTTTEPPTTTTTTEAPTTTTTAP